MKRVVILAKIQNAREASHHLTLTDNRQTFYLHAFAFVKGSLGLLLWPNSKVQGECITFLLYGPLNSMLRGDCF